jgi:uncharacterized protein
MEKIKGPIQTHERIHSIDAMRGFAILGIFLTNMLDFHSPMLYLNPYVWWSTKSDQTIYSIIDFFVQASFYPLFALLFGFGLMIIRERSLSRGYAFTPIAIRRLILLLLIGCIHAFFIWHGDILITYAICGFILLLFMRMSGKGLFLTGILLYVIPNLLMGLLLFLAAIFSPMTDYSNHDEANQSVEMYQNGSFLEVASQRFYDWSQVNSFETFPIIFFTIFPFLLIGAGVAKLNWIKNNGMNKKRLTVLLIIFVIVGSLLKILPFGVRNLFSEYVQDIFGGPLLAVSYAIVIILLIEKFSSILKMFQAVGKLALTNYLFQSIVSTLLFYSYGLGLYNKISVGEGTILALCIFMIQALISIIWTQKFHFGPIEWIWRAVTYWKKPNWRKKVT